VPRALARVCRRALAPNPADRYPTADALADDLDRYLDRPRRWKLLAVAAVFAVLTASLLLALYWSLVSRPVALPPVPQFVIAQVERPGEQPRLFRDALPLRSEDKLSLDCKLPAGYHARVFTRDTNGTWEEFTAFQIHRESRLDRLTADVVWKGAAGTRVLLVCAGSSQPPSLDELKPVLGEAIPWPQLPAEWLIWLNQDTVEVEKSRGLEVTEPSATSQVLTELRNLRARLRTRLGEQGCFFGVAYSHAG
jgi:hypothetical protein